MYRVLIVDDELPVRIYLRSLFGKELNNIELLDDAADGVDALNKIERQTPDIIILDLGMPFMNGLQVIERLMEQGFTGKIIVLSCHDDFENVKEALKMGAVDYLLKHTLKPDKLIMSVNKAIDAIQKDNVSRDEKIRLQQIFEANRLVLRDKFVKELVAGNTKDEKTITERMEQLGFKMHFTKFVVIVVEIDELYRLKEKYSQIDLTLLMKSVTRIIDEVAGEKETVVYGCIDEGCYCLIIDFDKDVSYMNINSLVFETCRKILNNIKNMLNILVSIGLSRTCHDIDGIKECYMQAKLALSGKLYFGRNKIIHFSEVEKYNCGLENFMKEHEKQIYDAINKNESIIKECVKEIFSRLKMQNIKTGDIRVLSFELLAFANKTLKEYQLGYNDIFGCEHLPYEHVMNLETICDIEEWFTGVCCNINRKINNTIKTKFSGECRMEIKKALEYIGNNYNRNISLQEISDYIVLSRTYFSQLFKQETGENFIEYLLKYRIEKAKWLLRNSQLKVYEVGFECGLDNYRYFARVFKEITGVTPVKFRDQFCKDI